MGLLYDWFGIHPTTVNEGVDLVKKKSLDTAVINMGREFRDDCAAIFGVSAGFVELRAGKVRVKEYGPEISYVENLYRAPNTIDDDNMSMLRFALRKKHELRSAGIACSVFIGGKTVDDKMIKTLRTSTNQFTRPEPPVPAHVYAGLNRH